MLAAVRALFDFDDVVVTAPGGTRMLAGLSTAVPAEGVTVIAGPSGAGKSTMLRLCNRLEVPTSGTVVFRGDDVAGIDPLVLRRRVGMVFQRPTPFPGTVRDNLLVARSAATGAELHTALERAALPADMLDRVADELSGGEAQRCCLARTLVTQPAELLMAAPTAALDPTATRTLERLARSLADDGVAVLWVTHDLAQLARLADTRIVLAEGRLADAHRAERYLSGAEA
ncbi:MAG: phosphate ABC transporter ATP-binding protein [Actinobacteria bacterium]|nr:phosphate ABC transporter ATP-binding protein [Actinomycetota bacterium]